MIPKIEDILKVAKMHPSRVLIFTCLGLAFIRLIQKILIGTN